MSVMETATHRHWSFKNKNPELMPPPTPLAEHLSPQLALNALRHNMTLKKPEGLFHSAWTHVEFALNQDNGFDLSLRKKYVGDAAHLLGEVLARPKGTSEATYIQALLLSAYLPLFMKRAAQQSIEEVDCDYLYVSIGSVINESMIQHYGEDIPWQVAEMMFDAGAARTRQPELLLFPTSPREEAGRRQQGNHDRYFINQGFKKPLQLKLKETDKQYDSPIVTLIIMPIVDHAFKQAGYDVRLSNSTKIVTLTDIMCREAAGHPLDASERILVQRFSRSVVARCRFSEAFIPAEISA